MLVPSVSERLLLLDIQNKTVSSQRSVDAVS